MSIENLPSHSGVNKNSCHPAKPSSGPRHREVPRSAILTKIFELFLSTGGRAPAAIAERMTRAALALFNRADQRRRRRVSRLPPRYLSNNHLRQDIGLRPVDPRDWPI